MRGWLIRHGLVVSISQSGHVGEAGMGCDQWRESGRVGEVLPPARELRPLKVPALFEFVVLGEIEGTWCEVKYLTDGRPDQKKTEPFVISMPDNRYWKGGRDLGQAWGTGTNWKKVPMVGRQEQEKWRVTRKGAQLSRREAEGSQSLTAPCALLLMMRIVPDGSG